jgi:transcriptional regulator with XRE-family HTH domain
VKRKRTRSKQPTKTRAKLDGPIHDRIASLRDKAGLSQLELAELVGVDKSAVSHWENKFSRPDLSRLSLVARALGVTVAELIRGEGKVAA